MTFTRFSKYVGYMTILPVVVLVCIDLSGCGSTDRSRDIPVRFLAKLNWLSTQGQADAIPSCRRLRCMKGEPEMLRSLRERIDWRLVPSLKSAKQCQAEAAAGALQLKYFCADLAFMDSKSLYSMYGVATAFPNLNDAFQALKSHDQVARFNARRRHATGRQHALGHELGNFTLEREEVIVPKATARVRVTGSRHKNVFYKRASATGANQAGTVRRDMQHRPPYPEVKVVVDGRALLFNIDTGSSNTLITRSAARRVGATIFKDVHQGGLAASGENVEAGVGFVRTFTLGDVTIRHKYVEIAARPFYATDGIIGLDVLDKLPAFAIAGNVFIINPPWPAHCTNSFHMASDVNMKSVLGIVVSDARFNGRRVAALLDTGNSLAGVIPTVELLSDLGIKVPMNKSVLIYDGAGDHIVKTGEVSGNFTYLGRRVHGKMPIAVNLPGTSIDFDVGMPFFYGKSLYVSFAKMKMCVRPKHA